LPAGGEGAAPTRRIGHSSGEGIGLSIVKRLCELLDASIVLANTHETGTTFRVVFPRSYQLPPAPPKIGESKAL
jgi:signal transduction histidine kinase